VRHEYVKKQQQELESRKIEESLKQMDKQDNVARIFKQQEYQKAQLMAKIQMDNERGKAVQIQKQELLEQRKVIQKQMLAEKEVLMSKFESIQRTGKIPDDLMEKLGHDRVQSLKNNETGTSQKSDKEKSSPQKPLPKSQEKPTKVKPQNTD